MPFSQLTDFLQSLPEPYLIFDTNYRIISINPAFKKYCHSQDTPIIGKTCYEISHGYELPCDYSGETCPLKKSLQSGKTEHVLHMHHIPEGEEYVSIALTPIKNTNNDIIGFVEKINPLKTVKHHSPPKPEGISAPFKKMVQLLHKIASSDISVLIEGESGSGKSTAAQYIHQLSKRCTAPFTPINCSTLTERQFEEIFFGNKITIKKQTHIHASDKWNFFNEGTLFLKNISDLNSNLQAQLVHLIENNVCNWETSKTNKQNIRIIASSQNDLYAQTQNGLFRKDLYYLLNRLPIRMPSLRERVEDILFLSNRFIAQLSAIPKSLSYEAATLLQTYSFPGNIRELKNIIERACLLSDTPIITQEHLLLSPILASTNKEDIRIAKEQSLISYFGGNRKELAKTLGISERTLYRKLARIKGHIEKSRNKISHSNE